MLTVEGIYKDGKIELLETVSAEDRSKVLVTFLEDSEVQLDALGIDEAEAFELRRELAAFEDWNDPLLDVYNDYDRSRRTIDENGA